MPWAQPIPKSVCAGISKPLCLCFQHVCEHFVPGQSPDVRCVCEQVDPHIILIRLSGYCLEFICERGFSDVLMLISCRCLVVV